MPSANAPRPQLLSELHLLLSGEPSATTYQTTLEKILQAFDCTVGTLHRYHSDSDELELVAQRGIPASILGQVQCIPRGKGMAGLAAARLEPVQTCNLQTDESGVARPAAKETKVEGSIALPLLVDGVLRGTLGVAKPTPHEFSATETEALLAVGECVGGFL